MDMFVLENVLLRWPFKFDILEADRKVKILKGSHSETFPCIEVTILFLVFLIIKLDLPKFGRVLY
jgi:hypothetical protein